MPDSQREGVNAIGQRHTGVAGGRNPGVVYKLDTGVFGRAEEYLPDRYRMHDLLKCRSQRFCTR